MRSRLTGTHASRDCAGFFINNRDFLVLVPNSELLFQSLSCLSIPTTLTHHFPGETR